MEFLKEGDVFELAEGHDVYVKNFPQFFLYDNSDFIFKLTSGELHIGGMQRGLDTAKFTGKYVVTKTCMDGGGTSHDGGYPDGHHVYAKKLIGNKTTNFEISFYQSGHFTCMNTSIKPIGRAHLIYTFEQ